jgi:hypothetical protein
MSAFEVLTTRSAVIRFSVMAVLSGLAAVAVAQRPVAPKVELFGGYSYLYPDATLTGTLPGGIVPVSTCMCAIPKGFGVAATYDFTRWFGITGDFSGHWSPQSSTPSLEIGHANLFTYSGGPKFTYRTRHFSPFAEALVGAHHLAPELFTADTKFGVIAGGGLDWMPTRHFGIRLVQADYVVSNHHFGTQASTPDTDLRGVRLQAGVVFMFGGHGPAPIAAAAAPVAAAAVVEAPAPPAPLTMTCSANPSSMMVGDTSIIHANAVSAHPVTYSYSASAGAISGTEATATLTTAGVAAGTIEVTCNAVDELGQKASQTVDVLVAAVPVAAIQTPSVQPMCSISFMRDKRRPTRVDNEAKACLDDVALAMQRDASATLLLVGTDSPTHHETSRDASIRAENAKAYLVTDKGIEPSRIVLYTGTTDSESVDIQLAPAGSTPDTSAITRIR